MKQKFTKDNTKKFAVVHRGHEDPLYYDNDVSSSVLVPLDNKKNKKTINENKNKIKNKNTGLAAHYGIFFNDDDYDYMKHLKCTGESEDAVVINSVPMSLNELLKDQFQSDKKREVRFDETECITSDLKGLKLDLDTEVKEVLDALDNEEYLDPNNEDGDEFFSSLLNSGVREKHDLPAFEEEDFFLDSFSDDYLECPYNEGDEPEELKQARSQTYNQEWEKDFKVFQHEKTKEAVLESLKKNSNESKTLSTKKIPQKSFSITSSAMFRTPVQRDLDEKYEIFKNKFSDDDEDLNDLNIENFDGEIDAFIHKNRLIHSNKKY